MAGRGSNKWVKAAHIKKGTQGSFNQMSFSVLDAASQAVENEQGEAPRKILGVIPLFTMNSRGESASASVPSKTLLKGDSGSGSADKPKSEPAHQRPKDQSLSMLAKTDAASLAPFEMRAAEKHAARTRRRVLVGVLMALLAVGFVGYIGYYLYGNSQNQQSQFSSVNQALSLIADADQDLTMLNDALADPSAQGSKETFEALTKKLPQTKIALQRARSLLDKGSEGLVDSRHKEIADRSAKAIEARMAMVEAGQDLSSQIANALGAADSLESAWTTILQADAQARGASSLLLNPTDENLAEATKQTDEAISQLEQASFRLSEVEARMDVDISLYKEYVEKRTQAFEAAKRAIAALVEKDTESAKAAQDEYSKADVAAAAVAAKFPQSPSTFVFQKYQENSKEAAESYSKARESAGTADSKLREYYASQHK